MIFNKFIRDLVLKQTAPRSNGPGRTLGVHTTCCEERPVLLQVVSLAPELDNCPKGWLSSYNFEGWHSLIIYSIVTIVKSFKEPICDGILLF